VGGAGVAAWIGGSVHDGPSNTGTPVYSEGTPAAVLTSNLARCPSPVGKAKALGAIKDNGLRFFMALCFVKVEGGLEGTKAWVEGAEMQTLKPKPVSRPQCALSVWSAAGSQASTDVLRNPARFVMLVTVFKDSKCNLATVPKQ
jgi:hypothetical protein